VSVKVVGMVMIVHSKSVLRIAMDMVDVIEATVYVIICIMDSTVHKSNVLVNAI